MVVSDIEYLDLNKIFDATDCCSELYRSGTTLFVLRKLAKNRDIVFDWAIDTLGRRGKLVDGPEGDLRHYVKNELRAGLGTGQGGRLPCYFSFF